MKTSRNEHVLDSRKHLLPAAARLPATDLTQRSGKKTGLFSYFVCRVSALPVSAIESLRGERCVPILNELFAIDRDLEAQREALSAGLFNIVGTTDDKIDRRVVIELRRDLFNLRRPGDTEYARAGTILPYELWESVKTFTTLIQARKRIETDLEKAYKADLTTARTRLLRVLNDDCIQNGLLLSSQSLYSAQHRYRIHDAEQQLSGRLERVERGLLRFVTRAAMKATPFGTLGMVIPGTIAPAAGGSSIGLSLWGSPKTRRSIVTLNKNLLPLLTAVFHSVPALRDQLRVELNDTLLEEGSRYFFLSSKGGQEIFQRLEKTSVLQMIEQFVKSSESTSIADVVLLLVEHPQINAATETATEFVEKLLEFGFIKLQLGVSDQDADWDESLRRMLESVHDQSAADMANLLRELRLDSERYGRANPQERIAILQARSKRVNEVLTAVRGRITRFPKLLWFEDSTADMWAAVPTSPGLAAIQEQLVLFVSLLRRLSWPRREQANMRHFYNKHYGSEKPVVPLYQFYEDYYREHLKRHLTFEKYETEEASDYDFYNPFGLDSVKAIQSAERKISSVIARRWAEQPDVLEIDITSGDLAHAMRGLSQPPAEAFSVNFFGELVDSKRSNLPLRLILTKGCSLGYGRLFSRYLKFLPRTFQEKLLNENLKLNSDLLAEISGDGDHNANLHPPLLQWAIKYPGSELQKTATTIEPTDLLVEPHEEDSHSLVLRDASGNRVVPVDLGFVWRKKRPALYQLLADFAISADQWILIPDRPEQISAIATSHAPMPASAENAIASSEVVYRPRITFNRLLVLERRSWRVESTAIPRQGALESDFIFFCRVNGWRAAHRIPSQVYIRLSFPPPAKRKQPGSSASLASRENDSDAADLDEANEDDVGIEARPGDSSFDWKQTRTERQSLNLRKPQFVDFESPLLVRVFAKMFPDLEAFTVVLQERYPTEVQLPSCRGERYSVEQVFQVNLDKDAFASTSE
jgi:lantibiotic biosynthesis protein